MWREVVHFWTSQIFFLLGGNKIYRFFCRSRRIPIYVPKVILLMHSVTHWSWKGREGKLLYMLSLECLNYGCYLYPHGGGIPFPSLPLAHSQGVTAWLWFGLFLSQLWLVRVRVVSFAFAVGCGGYCGGGFVSPCCQLLFLLVGVLPWFRIFLLCGVFVSSCSAGCVGRPSPKLGSLRNILTVFK